MAYHRAAVHVFHVEVEIGGGYGEYYAEQSEHASEQQAVQKIGAGRSGRFSECFDKLCGLDSGIAFNGFDDYFFAVVVSSASCVRHDCHDEDWQDNADGYRG